MATRVSSLERAWTMVALFNEGKTAYNPEGLYADIQALGEDEFVIEVRESDTGDLCETFSGLGEFVEWILDVESNSVD